MSKVLEHTPAPIQLGILIPSRDEWDHKFGYSLARLMGMLGQTLVADGILDYRLNMINGSIIDASRNSLIKSALKQELTHSLWLDTDMVFPPDIVHRFLKRNVVGVVAANYTSRRFPLHPVTFKYVGDERRQWLYTTDESTGLEEAEGVGMGVAWVDHRIFEKVAPPAFLSHYDPETGSWTGEDIYFCQKVREAGFPVMVDHDMSKEIRHAGRMEFGYQHAEAYRETDAEYQQAKVLGLIPKIITPEDPEWDSPAIRS